MISCCIWIIAFGRFDIGSATSSFNMLPREGYLKAVKRILSYLKTFPGGTAIVETTYSDHSVYCIEDPMNWMEFYPDEEEEILNDHSTS